MTFHSLPGEGEGLQEHKPQPSEEGDGLQEHNPWPPEEGEEGSVESSRIKLILSQFGRFIFS